MSINIYNRAAKRLTPRCQRQRVRSGKHNQPTLKHKQIDESCVVGECTICDSESHPIVIIDRGTVCVVLGAEDGMMQSAPMHVQRLCPNVCVCRKHAVRRHMFVGSANNDYELTRTTRYIEFYTYLYCIVWKSSTPS